MRQERMGQDRKYEKFAAILSECTYIYFVTKHKKLHSLTISSPFLCLALLTPNRNSVMGTMN